MRRFTMPVASFALVFLLACTRAALSGQPHTELSASTTVPFVLWGNHIYVRASIEGKPYAFIFDTGGSASLVPDVAKALALPVVASHSLTGVGENAVDANIVAVKRTDLGGAVYRDGAFFVLPSALGLTSPIPGLTFGGVLGREFYMPNVLTIDYARSTLTLAPPTSFTPDPRAVRLDMTMRLGHFPSVQAALDGHAAAFDIDAGSGGALAVTDTFAKSTGLIKDFPRSIDMEVGRGIGGPISGTVGRAQTLTLGTIDVPRPVVTVTRAQGGYFADGSQAGNIGGQILQRFKVTLDVPGGALYLSPSSDLTKPFAFNRAGLTAQRDGDRFAINQVIADSPAATAGVAVGDTIAEIDGKPVSGLNAEQIRLIWLQPAGTKVALILERDGRTRPVDLTLRDLI